MEPNKKEPYPDGDFYECFNLLDIDGNVTGGRVRGTGLMVNWQHGPTLVAGTGNYGDGENRYTKNGATVGDLLVAVRQRLQAYQMTKHACKENERALAAIEEAISAIQDRVFRRLYDGTFGTHKL